jgi:hypothetical protein
MWISMIFYVSGGRADGRYWPTPGLPFEVPDVEGELLVREERAVQIAAPEGTAVAEPLPADPVHEIPATVSEPAQTAGGPLNETGPVWAAAPVAEAPRAPEETAPEAAPEEPAKTEPIEPVKAPEAPVTPEVAEPAKDPGLPVPKPYAPKQAWVDYAMAHGATEDEAAPQTKEQLVAKYGSRL